MFSNPAQLLCRRRARGEVRGGDTFSIRTQSILHADPDPKSDLMRRSGMIHPMLCLTLTASPTPDQTSARDALVVVQDFLDGAELVEALPAEPAVLHDVLQRHQAAAAARRRSGWPGAAAPALRICSKVSVVMSARPHARREPSLNMAGNLRA